MRRKILKESKKDLINELLKKEYYNVQSNNYLGSPRNLYAYFKDKIDDLTFEHVKNWLAKQEIYNSYKYSKTSKRSQFVSSEIDRYWCADLADFRNISRFNDNKNYVLFVIDLLSKYLWCEIINKKTPENIIKAFDKVLRTGRKCSVLITDAGKEFINNKFKNYLNDKNINLFVMRNTEIKVAPVERVIRTIKEILYRHFELNKTKRFIEIIPLLVTRYNNTIHSRTKFKPVKVNKKNKEKVFLNLYKDRIVNKTSFLNIDDQVRILKLKKDFEKGFERKWSKEVFKIKKKLNTLPFKKYIISDLKNNEIIGTFYDFELNRI